MIVFTVKPCEAVIWYDHLWIAGVQRCFDSQKCAVQATLFQVMSVGSHVACAFVRVSLVRVHCAQP